jgi:hypothetical protein
MGELNKELANTLQPARKIYKKDLQYSCVLGGMGGGGGPGPKLIESFKCGQSRSSQCTLVLINVHYTSFTHAFF